jgi:LacI family transcriptional regulator
MAGDPFMIAERQRVTMKEIAEKIGISHATVSLALRNHPRISAKLRKRIQELAVKMGYEPDPHLTALSHYRHNRTRTPVHAAIAWLNCWSNPRELRSLHEFDACWEGACEGAKKLGYRLEEFVVDKSLPLGRVEKILFTRNIKGILLPPHREIPDLSGFNWNRFSVVRVGRTIPTPRMHVVSSDQTANAMLAFKKIREKGYQRIGYVGDDMPGRLFAAGFLQSQLQIPKSSRLPVLLVPVGDPANQSRILSWMERCKPQVILTDLSELPAFVSNAGYRVPEDVALVGLSLLDGNISASIDQHAQEVGRVAVLMVISQINDFSQGVPPVFRQILVEGSWVDGPSCPVFYSSKPGEDAGSRALAEHR